MSVSTRKKKGRSIPARTENKRNFFRIRLPNDAFRGISPVSEFRAVGKRVTVAPRLLSALVAIKTSPFRIRSILGKV